MADPAADGRSGDAMRDLEGRLTPEARELVRQLGRDLYLRERQDANSLPVIKVEPGQLARIVPATCDALRQAGAPIYERGSQLVRPETIDAARSDKGISRPAGATIIRSVTQVYVYYMMTQAATWRRYDARSGTMRPVNPPDRVAAIIADAADVGGWPSLVAIADRPMLMPDGRLIANPGYDPESCLLLRWAGEWPLNLEPDRDDAADAMLRMSARLRHFPWGSAVDRSVAISLFLTAIARPALDVAPAHGVSSREPGTGKSLIIDAASIAATGVVASVLDWTDDHVEASKRIDAAVLAGDAFIAIDNVARPLEGPTLCQAGSQTSMRIRPLGTSVMVSAPVKSFITATGVNLSTRGDFGRRIVVCTLDAGVEQPELRSIDQDLLAEVRACRREIVSDLITIMHAYARAGSPDVGLPPLGGYAQWSRMVRSALVFCGGEDVCLSMARLRNDDPARAAQRAIFSAWARVAGSAAATAAEMIALARDDAELRAALELVALRRGHLDAPALGWWLRAHRDRRVDRLVLVADGATRDGIVRWRVQEAT